jgi:hypothetical protein
LKKFKIFKKKQDRNQQNYDVDLTKLLTPDEVSDLMVVHMKKCYDWRYFWRPL